MVKDLEFSNLFHCRDLVHLSLGTCKTNLSSSIFKEMANTFRNLKILTLKTERIDAKDLMLLVKKLPLCKVRHLFVLCW